jgi:hypothetical protein
LEAISTLLDPLPSSSFGYNTKNKQTKLDNCKRPERKEAKKVV